MSQRTSSMAPSLPWWPTNCDVRWRVVRLALEQYVRESADSVASYGAGGSCCHRDGGFGQDRSRRYAYSGLRQEYYGGRRAARQAGASFRLRGPYRLRE